MPQTIIEKTSGKVTADQAQSGYDRDYTGDDHWYLTAKSLQRKGFERYE